MHFVLRARAKAKDSRQVSARSTAAVQVQQSVQRSKPTGPVQQPTSSAGRTRQSAQWFKRAGPGQRSAQRSKLADPAPNVGSVGSTSVASPRIEARFIELKVGSATGEGVTVQRIKLGPNVQHIVIDRSRAVQIGDHNRQLNHFRYDLVRPRVAVDDVFRGHPGRQRAFARLVDNPHSIIANWVFRQYLSGSARSRGCVRFTNTSGPRMVRVAARLDERGRIVVSRSSGVQVGDRNTQHNRFSYRAVGQEFPLEPMLRDCPQLVRSLAVADRYPGNAAAQRSFTGQLTSLYTQPNRSVPGSSAQFRRAAGLIVGRGAGVQLGSGDTRVDRVAVNVRGMVLTRWTSRDRPTMQARSSIDARSGPVGRSDTLRRGTDPRSGRPSPLDAPTGRWLRWVPRPRYRWDRSGRSGR
jgi:hypothetical protein